MGGGKGGGGGGGGGKGGGSAPQAKIPTAQIAEMENKFNQLGTYESQFLNFAPAMANFGLNAATGGLVPGLPTNATGLGPFQIPGVGGGGGAAGTGGGDVQMAEGGFGGSLSPLGGDPTSGGAWGSSLASGSTGYLQSLGPLLGGSAADLSQAGAAITGGNAPGIQTLGPVFLPGGISGTLLKNPQTGGEVAVTPNGQYYGINPDGSITPYSLQQVNQMGFLSGTGLPAQQAATLAETQGLQAEQQQLYGQGQNLYNMATTGTGLFPSQQAFVNQATQSEQAQLEQQMANAGLTSSTQAGILQGEAAQQGAATAGQLIQGNIQAAQNQIQLSNQAAQLVLAGQELSLQQENALFGQSVQLAQQDQSIQQQTWTQGMQGIGAMGSLLQNVLGPFNAQANMIALQTEANLQNAQIAAGFEEQQNQQAAGGMSSLFSGLLGPLSQGGGSLLGGLLGGGGAAAGGALGGGLGATADVAGLATMIGSLAF